MGIIIKYILNKNYDDYGNLVKGRLNLKRKRGNREGWPRIQQQKFVQQYINNQDFKGYITLLYFEKVKQPLIAKYTPTPITLVQNGSYMLQHFPENEHFSLTTFISPKHEIIQWYIDIIDSIGIENEVVYMDDLFLDLIVLPDKTVIEKDIDEINEALEGKVITEDQYNIAWKSFKELKYKIDRQEFSLLNKSMGHFKLLLNQL